MRSIIILFLLSAACTEGIRSDPALGEAQCNAMDGPLHDYSTKAELNQLILGTWVHCSGPTLMGSNEVGIEFVAGDSNGGTYNVLVDDGHGGLVRETGFDGQGTWGGVQLSPTSVEFGWDNASKTDPNEGIVTFEDQPRKLAIALTESSIYALYP